MDYHRREFLVARVVSGVVRIRIPDARGDLKPFLVTTPDKQARYVAQEVYAEAFEDAQQKGLFSEEEILERVLKPQGLWDDKREETLKKIPKDIEDFKVKLFQARFRSNERKKLRQVLETAKQKLGELRQRRSAYDHLTCAGAAASARARYLLGCALVQENGKPCFTNDDFWVDPSPLLDSAMKAYAASKLSEAQYRELARTDPWRSIWQSRNLEAGLFGIPATEYSEEQRALTGWSGLYENALQHPDCPADGVFDDDDAFDGWLILQRRKREEGGKKGDGLVASDKIANSQEIYLVADTHEDAMRVMEMNDEEGRRTQRQRFDLIEKRGEVKEMEMPDTKRRFREAAMAKFAASVKQG